MQLHGDAVLHTALLFCILQAGFQATLTRTGHLDLVFQALSDLADFRINTLPDILELGIDLQDTRVSRTVLDRQFGKLAHDLGFLVAQLLDQRRGQHLVGGFNALPVLSQQTVDLQQTGFSGSALGPRDDQLAVDFR